MHRSLTVYVDRALVHEAQVHEVLDEPVHADERGPGAAGPGLEVIQEGQKVGAQIAKLADVGAEREICGCDFFCIHEVTEPKF